MLRWILDLLRQMAERIAGLAEPPILDSEEKTRLHHFRAFLVLGITTMVGFGIYDWWKSDWVLTAVIFAMAMSLVISWHLLKRLQWALWVYRINALFFGGMLLFLVARGGENVSKALWLFTFPLAAFFLLNTTEGFIWTLAIFLGAVSIFWGPLPGQAARHYSAQFTIRFSAVYLIISLLACWFEYLRQHYRKGMEAEHQRLLAERAALAAALSKVRQLSGMLPICASCKMVRDDQGYWTQIETYIRDHSDAEFSHGLCPDCGERLYPGLYKRHEQQG